MSMFSDFLSEHSLSADDVVKRSKAIETLSTADRALLVKRSDARREKKSYDELKLDKPKAYGSGVTDRTMKQAVEGQPIPRISRKKITRAVNSLLVSAKKSEVEWRALFADAPARKGKAPKGKK